MSLRWSLCIPLVALLPLQAADPKKLAPEPRLLSISPLTGPAGATYRAVLRGTGIADALRLEIGGEGLTGRILSAKKEESSTSSSPNDLIEVEIKAAADALPGTRTVRLIASNGLTNALSLRIAGGQVVPEEKITGTLQQFPVTITGTIEAPGETDAYWLAVEAGQILTVEIVSGHSSFDPSIAVYEPSGSWFDPDRLNRLAFNDEPLHFPGLSSNAFLTYRFQKAGRYCLKVAGFAGQGGPNHVYELQIRVGPESSPALRPSPKQSWEERQFTRTLSPEWLKDVSLRSGAEGDPAIPETYRASSESGSNLPVMKAPGIVQGKLTKPAEVHSIRLRVDQAQDLAFELETPEATMPRFNPVIRLLDANGAEVFTNIHTKLNNNGLYMMKMIQAKVTVSFPNPGEYTMQIRDITTDCSGGDFAYRVLVRPQIPHLGRVLLAEETWNVRAGATKAINLTVEREEGFTAPVMFSVEGLPAGLTATTAVPVPEEKPPLFNGGKMDRYTPKSHTAVLLISASPDAAPSQTPVTVRVVARPFDKGAVAAPIPIQEVTVLVLPRSTS